MPDLPIPRPTTGSPQTVIDVKCQVLEFLIAARRAGQAGRRLWRTGQGQHAAQLLRHRTGAAALHRGPQPAQAGALPAGQPDSDPAAGTHPRRLGRTTCSSCPGICVTRSSIRCTRCATGAAGSSCRSRSCRSSDAVRRTGACRRVHGRDQNVIAMSAAGSRARSAATSSPRDGLTRRLRPMQRVVQCAPGHAAGHAFPARAARGDKARALHARRCVRRPAGPAPWLPDVPLLARRRVERGERRCRLHPGRPRPWLPDADRRDRGLLPDHRALRARRLQRRALGRPGIRIDWPIRPPILSDRDGGYGDYREATSGHERCRRDSSFNCNRPSTYARCSTDRRG